jgi:hypothetical protein
MQAVVDCRSGPRPRLIRYFRWAATCDARPAGLTGRFLRGALQGKRVFAYKVRPTVPPSVEMPKVPPLGLIPPGIRGDLNGLLFGEGPD